MTPREPYMIAAQACIAAADACTIASAFRDDPRQAELRAEAAEDALNAALEAVAGAIRATPRRTSFLSIAADIAAAPYGREAA